MNIINVQYVTDFQWLCGLSDFLSWHIRYRVSMHCCKWPNYNFGISQGNVVTILMWGGLNYSHLRQVASWCCVPKKYRNRPMFHRVIKKIKVTPVFLRRGVYSLWLPLQEKTTPCGRDLIVYIILQEIVYRLNFFNQLISNKKPSCR